VELEDMTPERPPELVLLGHINGEVIIAKSYNSDLDVLNMTFHSYSPNDGIRKIGRVGRLIITPYEKPFAINGDMTDIYASWIGEKGAVIKSQDEATVIRNLGIPIFSYNNEIIYKTDDGAHIYSPNKGLIVDTLPTRYIPRYINAQGIVATDMDNDGKTILLQKIPPYDKIDDYGNVNISEGYISHIYMDHTYLMMGNTIYMDNQGGLIPLFSPDASFPEYHDYIFNGVPGNPLGALYLIDTEYGIVYSMSGEVVYEYSSVISSADGWINSSFTQLEGYIYIYLPAAGLYRTTDFSDVEFLGKVESEDVLYPNRISLFSSADNLYLNSDMENIYTLDDQEFRYNDLLDYEIRGNQQAENTSSLEMSLLGVLGNSGGYTYILARNEYYSSYRELYIKDESSGMMTNYFINDFYDGQPYITAGDGYIYSRIYNPGLNKKWFGLVSHKGGEYDSIPTKSLPEVQQDRFYNYHVPVEYRNHLFLLGRMAELGADTLDFAQAIRVEYDGTVREDIHIKDLAESEDRLFAIDSAGARYVFDDADKVFKPIEEGSSIKHPADRLQIRNGNEISIDYGETFTEITQVSEVNQIATLGSRVFIVAEDEKKVYEVMNIGSMVNGDDASPFYPNPSGNGIFYSPEPISGGRVYDVSGRAVDAMISGDRIDLGTAPAGVYYLVTESGERHVLVRK
jgi:hypothetical protein